MPKRRAPKGGYDFEAKRQYRKAVWLTFRDEVRRSGKPLGLAQAMLMPSSEGTEIEVALDHGFREENLHIVDKNAAIVATHKKRYPRINTYGVEVERAFERMRGAGLELDCANVDLCSNASESSVLDVLWASGVPAKTIAVTLLRGREIGTVGSILRDVREFADFDWSVLPKPLGDYTPGNTDAARLALMWSATRRMHVPKIVRWGIYRSGNQTMMWTIVSDRRLSRDQETVQRNRTIAKLTPILDALVFRLTDDERKKLHGAMNEVEYAWNCLMPAERERIIVEHGGREPERFDRAVVELARAKGRTAPTACILL